MQRKLERVTRARTFGIVAALALLAAGLLTPPAMAELPHSFKGGITINGANAPAGTTWVWAEIDGVLYGQDSTTSATSGGGYSGTEYALEVTGDQFEPADPKQGGVAGDNVIFWVVTNGGADRYVAALGAVFAPGSGPDTLALAVTTADNPAAWPLLSEVNPANTTADWVELYNPGATDLALTAGWALASEGSEATVPLAGVTVPAGGYSSPVNITDLTILDSPASGDVVRLTYAAAPLAGGATIVVDRLEYGNPAKPADAMGRARQAGANPCVADVSNGCVWDVNVAGTGSTGQTFAADRSLHRAVPADTDRWVDWTVGVPTPVWPSLGPPPVVAISSPRPPTRVAHNQAQSLAWTATDADNAPAELSVWINVSYAGSGGPWQNLFTGNGAGTTAPWTPSPPCTPGADLPNTFLLGEALDPNGNRGSDLDGALVVDCTAPAVTLTVPADDSSTAAPNQVIDITFSEAMAQAPTQGAFQLDGVAVPAGNVTWVGPAQVRVSHAAWASGSGHDFTIGCAAVDVAVPNGNPLQACPYSWNWTVTTANTPPSITLGPSPAATDIWSMASSHPVAWTVSDGQDTAAQLLVDLEYTNDGGNTWFPVVAGRAGNLSPFSWTTPSANCGSVQVRGTVTDTGALQATALSPVFTLDCTEPTVTGTDPFDGETGVTVVKTVRITFSERMERATTELSVSISPSQPPTLAFDSFQWQLGDTVLLLGHSVNFDPGVAYTVSVRCTPAASAAQDISDPGNTLAGCPSPFSFGFTTAIGNSAPEIILDAPAGGERWSGNTDHAMTWTMNDDGGASGLLVDLTYSTDGGASWNPVASGLVGAVEYNWTVPCLDAASVVINATVTDTGTPSLQDWSQTPPFAIDCTPPSISATIPLDGTTGVATNAAVVIDFSEPINNATLAGPCGVAFTPPVGAVAYAWSNGNRTLTVAHADFAANQGYTVTVCNAIRDLSDPGLTLAGPNSFGFTAGVVGNAPPTVTVTAPTGGTFVHGQPIAIAWTMADAETATGALGVTVTYSANGGTETGTVATLTGQLSTTWPAPIAFTATDVTVTVTVRDGGGLTAADDSAPFTIAADTTDPAGSITGPTDPAAGTAVTYTCDCSDNSGGALTYAWRVLQGGQPVPGASGTGPTFGYTFPAAGAYTVEVIVSDPSGNDATFTLDVTSSQVTDGGFPLWILILLAVLVLILLLFLWSRRRKKPEEGPAPPAPPATPAETAPQEFPPPESFPPPEPPPQDRPPEPPADTPPEAPPPEKPEKEPAGESPPAQNQGG